MPPPIPDHNNPVFDENDGLNFGEDDEEFKDDSIGEQPVGTVVSMAEVDDDEDDDDDILNHPIVGDLDGNMAPVAKMSAEDPAPAPKKRGRPSLSASVSRNGTPAVTPVKPAGSTAKTQRTAPKSTAKSVSKASASAKANTAKKRKASADDEGVIEATPAKKKAKVAARPVRDPRPPTGVLAKRQAATEAKADIHEQATKKLRAPNGTAKLAKKSAGGKRGRPKAAPKAAEEPAAETWEVEKILEADIDGPTKAHLYLVKWKGYPESANTWEPRKNLVGCAELLKEFDAQNKQPRKTKATKVAKATKAKKAAK